VSGYEVVRRGARRGGRADVEQFLEEGRQLKESILETAAATVPRLWQTDSKASMSHTDYEAEEHDGDHCPCVRLSMIYRRWTLPVRS